MTARQRRAWCYAEDHLIVRIDRDRPIVPKRSTATLAEILASKRAA